MQYFHKSKIRLLLLLVVVPFPIVFFMKWFVQKATYPVPNIPVGPPPAPMKFVSVPYSHENFLTGWIYQKEESRVSLLYLHGNGENLETIRHSGLLEQLQDLEISFLVVDYPGYGQSKGKPSEKSLTESAKASIEFLSRSLPQQRIVVCGWSLGASVAVLAAEKNPRVDGLIVISAWTMLEEVAALHFPSLMVKAFPSEKYDSLEAAKSVLCPALVLHGEQDSLIPAEQGEQVAANLPNLQKWLKIANAGHNDLLEHPEVWVSISNFLKGFNR